MTEIRHKRTRAVVYRHKGSLAGAELRRADLHDANLARMNLAGADLSGASLSAAILEGTNLSHAGLDGADLSGASLCDATLSYARIRGANLRGTTLPDRIDRVDFTGSTLCSVVVDRPANSEILDCDFTETDLRGTDLRGLTFRRCSFRGADMRGTQMDGWGVAGYHAMIAVNAAVGTLIPLAFRNVVLANAPGTLIGRILGHGSFLSWNWWLQGFLFALIMVVWSIFWSRRVRRKTHFDSCDLTDVIYDGTTRWTGGFVPPMTTSR